MKLHIHLATAPQFNKNFRHLMQGASYFVSVREFTFFRSYSMTKNDCAIKNERRTSAAFFEKLYLVILFFSLNAASDIMDELRKRYFSKKSFSIYVIAASSQRCAKLERAIILRHTVQRGHFIHKSVSFHVLGKNSTTYGLHVSNPRSGWVKSNFHWLGINSSGFKELITRGDSRTLPSII